MFHVMVQIANIIFVDAPVGTGFSYSTTGEGYHVSDTISAAETYEFLRKVRESVFLNRKIYKLSVKEKECHRRGFFFLIKIRGFWVFALTLKTTGD